ncbi:hypothetical protein TNCV_5133861 [Trichonephila clavipes]|nr:hypothetical protein TNCV_5133861 [Trichonephila clavipes]
MLVKQVVDARFWTSTHPQSKRTSETFLLDKAKSVSDSGDSPKQYTSKCKCFGTHSSAHTVDMKLFSRRPLRVTLMTRFHSKLRLNHLPRICDIHAKASCSRFADQRRRNGLLKRITKQDSRGDTADGRPNLGLDGKILVDL